MKSKKQRKNDKKVLQIITKSNFGGAQKYVYELSKKLSEDNFEVVVAHGGEGLLVDKLQKQNIRTEKIKSLGRNINLISDIKVFFEIIKIINKEKPGIVHLNSSKIGAIGSIAARFCFVPRIIFTIHGLAFNENRSVVSKNIIKLIYSLAITWSHKSIAVSENVRKNVLNIPLGFIINKKVVTIKNGINKIDFIERDQARDFIFNRIKDQNKETDQETTQELESSLRDKKIIGTVAELHHIKGINYLIDSAIQILEKNPKTIFVVFGDGDEKVLLEKKIKELKLEDKFFLLGFVEDASKYLKAFDLFVLPSIYEGLALVILEAKQARLKIAASNIGGIPEAISNYKKAVLFEAKNPNNMSEKISQILSEDFNTENGNEEYQNEDSIELMYQKTISTYQNSTNQK
jgi:glycosyltransferase involved in cell wall biosynthesis